jgi:hypothetical protein
MPVGEDTARLSSDPSGVALLGFLRVFELRSTLPHFALAVMAITEYK